MNTRCCGSLVWADPPFFPNGSGIDAVCSSCYALVPVIPDGSGFRLVSHQRPVVSNPAEDAMYTIEFDDEGKAA